LNLGNGVVLDNIGFNLAKGEVTGNLKPE